MENTLSWLLLFWPTNFQVCSVHFDAVGQAATCLYTDHVWKNVPNHKHDLSMQ